MFILHFTMYLVFKAYNVHTCCLNKNWMQSKSDKGLSKRPEETSEDTADGKNAYVLKVGIIFACQKTFSNLHDSLGITIKYKQKTLPTKVSFQYSKKSELSMRHLADTLSLCYYRQVPVTILKCIKDR